MAQRHYFVNFKGEQIWVNIVNSYKHVGQMHDKKDSMLPELKYRANNANNANAASNAKSVNIAVLPMLAWF